MTDELPDPWEMMNWDDAAETFMHMTDRDDDLRAHLEEYLEERSEVFETVAFYREHGSFRNIVELTDDERALLERNIEHQQPKECYYNTQTAIIGVVDEPVEYVEGFTISSKAPAPTPHAWLEVNGKVAEITMPGGMPEGAVYYGVSYDAQTVRMALLDRGVTSPLAENPDEYDPK